RCVAAAHACPAGRNDPETRTDESLDFHQDRQERDQPSRFGWRLRLRKTASMNGHALVVGVTGISGGNVAQRLLANGWQVSGLSRDPKGLDERIAPVAADLEDAEAVAAAVRGVAPTHVFFTTWS